MTLNSCTKHLAVGAVIREVYGKRRIGAVKAFDLDTGKIDVEVKVFPESGARLMNSGRVTALPSFAVSMSGCVAVTVLVKDLIKGSWRIDDPNQPKEPTE